MNVYVVIYYTYESACIHGVYSTREKAVAALNKLAERCKYGSSHELRWDLEEEGVLREYYFGGYTGECYVIRECKVDE